MWDNNGFLSAPHNIGTQIIIEKVPHNVGLPNLFFSQPDNVRQQRVPWYTSTS